MEEQTVGAALPKILLHDLFEGPLDLLLHLIKINEMDISDVRLTEITGQYLAYLDAMKELNLEIAGEYLVIAATLLQIKSRSLLPPDPTEAASDAEEIDAAVSTRQLLRRLIEFRKFKELAQRLKGLEEDNRGVFYRANILPVYPGPRAEPETQDIRILFDAFARILRFARTRPIHTVHRQAFRVEDKLVELREVIRSQSKINLREVFQRCICKEEIIVTFLATLEMARLREVTIAQPATFDDIYLAPWDDSVVYVG